MEYRTAISMVGVEVMTQRKVLGLEIQCRDTARFHS